MTKAILFGCLFLSACNEGGLPATSGTPPLFDAGLPSADLAMSRSPDLGIPSCADGLTWCVESGGCFSLMDDPEHCGQCNTACTKEQTCQSGTCFTPCKSGYTLDCDNNPANGCEAVIAADRNNCGGCGNVCGAFEVCQGGACLSCAGGNVCNNICTSCDTDPENCGQCGVACPSYHCVNGSCT